MNSLIAKSDLFQIWMDRIKQYQKFIQICLHRHPLQTGTQYYCLAVEIGMVLVLRAVTLLC